MPLKKEEKLMSVPIQPLADYIVAQTEKAETKTASGLYLPDKAQEKPKIAKVLAVGPGKACVDGKTSKMVVQIGDRILYKSYSTTEVKVGSEDYILVKEEDVLATVK
jgi:chaperonin GroES